ncbi:hypothetical protein DIPPA_04279 [Diplonema papillatum]|nr:hypothetical protein DIPPA_04279 [Diplonema papillatum]
MQPDHEKAVYGFALWVAAWVLFVVFVAWGLRLVPETLYFPHSYWSLGVPAMLAVAMIAYLLLVPLTGMAGTFPLSDRRTVTDPNARRITPSQGLPSLGDIPIARVSEALYGRPRRAVAPAKKG